MTAQARPMRDRRGRVYTPAVGPRLRPFLWIILIGFALLGANGFYLSSVTALTWYLGSTQQTPFYMLMVALHLLLGFLLIVPFLIFGFAHLATSWKRPNKAAVRFGLALLATVAGDPGLGAGPGAAGGIRGPRSAGPRGGLLAARARAARRPSRSTSSIAWPARVIRWEWARRFSVAVAGFVVLMGLLHLQDPRSFGVKGPKEGKQYFYPSEAITANGKFIPPRTLMMDDYCLKCHQDAYAGWFHSAHHFSSFNNKAYLTSVRETRQVALEARRLDPGRALVRRLPRSGAVLLGRVRRPELRRREQPDQPGRHHLHGLPRDHQRQQHPRQRRLHHRGAPALSLRLQRRPALAMDQQRAREGQARDAQEDLLEAGHQGPQVLLDLPQGRACRSESPTTRISSAGRTITTRFCSRAFPATGPGASTIPRWPSRAASSATWS